MDSYDGDMKFLANLADKYKKTSITKKDLYVISGGILLLLGMLFFQTVNALTLQFKNIKLERTLAQYSKPAENQSPVNELPEPYALENVSYDFTKPMPSLSASYLDNKNGTCNSVDIELPPTLSKYSNDLQPCVMNKEIDFGDSVYSVQGINIVDI